MKPEVEKRAKPLAIGFSVFGFIALDSGASTLCLRL